MNRPRRQHRAPSVRRRRPLGRRALPRRQPWAGPLLALGAVVNGGAVAYHLVEGWDWGDCYWMVLIILSTLGLTDTHAPVLSHGGRVVT
ncbi:MAG: ion channel, partial [Vulcanococcus sp.]